MKRGRFILPSNPVDETEYATFIAVLKWKLVHITATPWKARLRFATTWPSPSPIPVPVDPRRLQSAC